MKAIAGKARTDCTSSASQRAVRKKRACTCASRSRWGWITSRDAAVSLDLIDQELAILWRLTQTLGTKPRLEPGASAWVREPPQDAELAIQHGQEVLYIARLDPAPGQRDAQMSLRLARAARRDAEEVQPVVADSFAAFGEVRRNRRSRSLDLRRPDPDCAYESAQSHLSTEQRSRSRVPSATNCVAPCRFVSVVVMPVPAQKA